MPRCVSSPRSGIHFALLDRPHKSRFSSGHRRHLDAQTLSTEWIPSPTLRSSSAPGRDGALPVRSGMGIGSLRG